MIDHTMPCGHEGQELVLKRTRRFPAVCSRPKGHKGPLHAQFDRNGRLLACWDKDGNKAGPRRLFAL